MFIAVPGQRHRRFISIGHAEPMKILDRLIRLASSSPASAPAASHANEILRYEAELDVVERFLQRQEARRLHPSAFTSEPGFGGGERVGGERVGGDELMKVG